MMTEALKGKSRGEAEKLFERFHDLITGQTNAAADAPPLGKLEVFSGVREYPVRIKCATLPWHTMRSALNGAGQTISTEEGAEASVSERPEAVSVPEPAPKVC
jgi:nitrogen fixation protein NifU and related proteins